MSSSSPVVVFNIEPATSSMVRAMDEHEKHRRPDGTSAIDPERGHMNAVLVGDEGGPSRSLELLYRFGVQRPTAQAESPYLRVVISASPSYFRPDDPDAAGTWDQERMESWKKETLAWLKKEFGADLVFASIHLDEDTPHIHALIAPTYERKPRQPGKKKRGETDAEFQIRKAEATGSVGVRTVGRASHLELSKRGSFTTLRKSLALALAPLGIEYGEDRGPSAPDGLSTREWVRQETVRLRKAEEQLDADRRAHLEQKSIDQERIQKSYADTAMRAELLKSSIISLQDRQRKVEEREAAVNQAAQIISETVDATLKGTLTITPERKIAIALPREERAIRLSRIRSLADLLTVDRVINLIGKIQSAIGGVARVRTSLSAEKSPEQTGRPTF